MPFFAILACAAAHHRALPRSTTIHFVYSYVDEVKPAPLASQPAHRARRGDYASAGGELPEGLDDRGADRPVFHAELRRGLAVVGAPAWHARIPGRVGGEAPAAVAAELRLQRSGHVV